jgi:hypothetical protein
MLILTFGAQRGLLAVSPRLGLPLRSSVGGLEEPPPFGCHCSAVWPRRVAATCATFRAPRFLKAANTQITGGTYDSLRERIDMADDSSYSERKRAESRAFQEFLEEMPEPGNRHLIFVDVGVCPGAQNSLCPGCDAMESEWEHDYVLSDAWNQWTCILTDLFVEATKIADGNGLACVLTLIDASGTLKSALKYDGKKRPFEKQPVDVALTDQLITIVRNTSLPLLPEGSKCTEVHVLISLVHHVPGGDAI